MERKGVDFDRHLQIVGLTLPMVLLGMSLRPRWLRKKAWLIYAASVAVLLLLPFVGSVHNGAPLDPHAGGVRPAALGAREDRPDPPRSRASSTGTASRSTVRVRRSCSLSCPSRWSRCSRTWAPR